MPKVAGSTPAVAIDEAQVSGVKGYPIGIFGAGMPATLHTMPKKSFIETLSLPRM